jgi:uncharacterized protein (DUF952 family)
MAEEVNTVNRPGSIFHVVRAEDLRWVDEHYEAASLATEGFIHASYREKVVESARLYFPADAELCVLEIDPAGLDVRVVETPRGPMPHVHGTIPRRAVVRTYRLGDFDSSSASK